MLQYNILPPFSWRGRTYSQVCSIVLFQWPELPSALGRVAQTLWVWLNNRPSSWTAPLPTPRRLWPVSGTLIPWSWSRHIRP
jgi:hypothetical protein